jgi:PKD repeat protein
MIIPAGSPQGFWLTYSGCCRTGTLTNVTNPLGQGMRVFAGVPNPHLNGCNNAPVITQWPPQSLCMLQPIAAQVTASDPDGDSVAFKLCHALGHAGPPTPPWPPLVYSGGFSGTYPMVTSPGMVIDPVTGVIAGIPTALGQFTVAICIEEWRNGQLIATHTIDVMICVTSDCTSGLIWNSSNGTVAGCDGLTVHFDGVAGSGTSTFWDFGDLGTLADTSHLLKPTYTYPDTGTYTATFITQGPLCADTTYATVVVLDSLSFAVHATPDTIVCEDQVVTLHAQSTWSNAWFWWENHNYVAAPDSQSTEITTPHSGLYIVKAMHGLGCETKDTVTVIFNPLPQPEITGVDSSYVVNGSPDTLYGIPPGGVFGGTGMIGNVFDPVLAGVGTHVVTYTYTHTNGCTGVDSVVMVVNSPTGAVDAPHLIISVHPNPTHDPLCITLKPLADGDLRLFDVSGNPVYAGAFEGGGTLLSLGGLPAGSYLLVVTSSDSIARRLVIRN